MTQASTPPSHRFASLVRAVTGGAYGLLPFAGAGTFTWGRGWVYFILFMAVSVVGGVVVRRASPGLMEARAKGIRKDTAPFDKFFFAFFAPLIVIYPVLGGMDAVRFTWSTLPDWALPAGIVLFTVGACVSTWTMCVNKNAELTARIQNDRAHTVITHGPYRVVRHPMYASIIIGLPATALILGSVYAMVPMGLIVGLFVWRTAREDRMLHTGLEGYADYARTTRYRLLPKLW